MAVFIIHFSHFLRFTESRCLTRYPHPLRWAFVKYAKDVKRSQEFSIKEEPLDQERLLQLAGQVKGLNEVDPQQRMHLPPQSMPGTRMIWPADPCIRACSPSFAVFNNCLLNDIRTIGLNSYQPRVPNAPLQRLGAPFRLAMDWHRGLENITHCLDDFPPLRYGLPQYKSHISSLTGLGHKIGPIFRASTHFVPPNDFSYGTKPSQDQQLRQDQEPDQEFNVLMHPPNLAKILSEEIRQGAEAWNTAVEKLATAKGKSLRYDPAKMITTYHGFESDLAKARYDDTLSIILMHGRLPDLPTLPTSKRRKLSHSAQDLQRNTTPKDESFFIPQGEKLVRINDIAGLPLRANGWYNVPGIQEADYATTSNIAVCIDIDQMSSRTRYIDNSRFRGMIHADTPGFGKTLFALAAIAVSAGLTGSINGLYIHRSSFVLPSVDGRDPKFLWTGMCQ